MKTIAVLFGGRSGEHEVSKNSASAIVKNLDHSKYIVLPIAIAKDGRWYGPICKDEIVDFMPEDYGRKEVYLSPVPGGNLIDAASGKQLAHIDAVIPIIHGTYGEDGILQGLLELAGVPYVGAGVAGSAVGMDKILMRKILAYHHIPQVDFLEVSRFEIEHKLQEVLKRLQGELSYPMFVKPSNAGSSVGVTKAGNVEELEQGLREAAKFDRRILVEQGHNVREIEISVMGNDEPKTSCPGEIIASNDFYDYKAKYIDNKSVAVIPAEITSEQSEIIADWAKKAYKALDCAGMGRMDFFIDKESGQIYLNEINTLPGFTEISMYAKLWAQGGMPMRVLLDELLAYAFDRAEDRKRNVIDF